MRSLMLCTVFATGLSLLTACVAPAAYTFSKTNPNETGVDDVLEHVYGGDFDASGVDYLGRSNGVTARRLPDESDQLWQGTYVTKIVGRFSGYTQAFGYLNNSGFQQLANATLEGFNTGVSEEMQVTLAQPTALARSGNSGTQSSRDQDNRDARDHMITYAIEGLGGSPVWLLFWEDLNASPSVTKGRSSSDFNDLVVVLRMADVGVTPIAVPLPPAFGVGLVSLVVGVWFGRRALSRGTVA